MTRSVRAFLAGLAVAGPLAAQSPTPPAWAAKVDEVFASYAAGSSPGCAVAVIQDGAILYEKGYGLASLEFSLPIAPDTVFDIGSVSKQFAAASVILLSQEGKLSLDDDIRRFIPEVPDYGPTITIRHLFHHTSGLRDYTTLLSLAGARIPDRTTKEEALAMIARQKGVDFAPGAEESYCNSGYFLLSVLVQRASGKSLNEFAKERIFQPLGMADTQFLDDSRRIVPRKATGYAPREGGGFRLAGSNWEQVGDGSLLTTVRDLAKWARNFEQPEVGGPALVAEMERVGSLSDGTKLEYASGLRVDTWRGLRRVSHGGAWAGYRAALVRFPTERTALAVTCNRSDAVGAQMLAKVAEAVLAGRIRPAEPEAPAAGKPSPVGAAEAGRVEGVYFEPATFAVRRIERKDGGLVYRGDGRAAPIRRDASGAFRLPFQEPQPQLLFSPTGGRAAALGIRQEGQKPRSLRRVDSWTPAAPSLAGLTGVYESPELDTKFAIVLEGDRLVLHRRGEDPTALTPLFDGAFENEDVGVIVFSGNGTGSPAGSFEISTGDSKLRFLRRAS
jgi:CubicO group peptidase (beta-lactamase class C family)